MDTNERSARLEAAAVEASIHGLKSLLILNGGACVVSVGFISSLATSEHLPIEFLPLIKATSTSLLWFAGGAALTIVGWICAYLSNQRYANALQNPNRYSWSSGEIANTFGLLFVGLSLLAFLIGVGRIACAIP